MNKEYLVYGVPPLMPDYMEELAYEKIKTKEEAEELKSFLINKMGYERARIAVYVPNEKPDFIRTINT